jgi:hypothetical protein
MRDVGRGTRDLRCEGRGTRDEGRGSVDLGECSTECGRGKGPSVTGYFFLGFTNGKGKTADLVDHWTGESSWVLTWP